jgi:hypothetical protein
MGKTGTFRKTYFSEVLKLSGPETWSTFYVLSTNYSIMVRAVAASSLSGWRSFLPSTVCAVTKTRQFSFLIEPSSVRLTALLTIAYRAGCWRCNAVYLYSRGSLFGSWPEHRLSSLTSFKVFLSISRRIEDGVSNSVYIASTGWIISK